MRLVTPVDTAHKVDGLVAKTTCAWGYGGTLCIQIGWTPSLAGVGGEFALKYQCCRHDQGWQVKRGVEEEQDNVNRNPGIVAYMQPPCTIQKI